MDSEMPGLINVRLSGIVLDWWEIVLGQNPQINDIDISLKNLTTLYRSSMLAAKEIGQARPPPHQGLMGEVAQVTSTSES